MLQVAAANYELNLRHFYNLCYFGHSVFHYLKAKFTEGKARSANSRGD